MFSFTNILNPSPHFPSSSYNPFSPPAFTDHDPHDDDVFLHQHHQYFDPLSAPSPENVINFGVSKNPTMITRQNNGDPLNGASDFLAKIPVKKDRHSKIYTSQGLRDRRVRLSIDIARKFFDLQDLLGFDKASTTLDWLLTKSRKEIEEVAQMKQGFSSTSECDVFSEEIVSKSNSFASVVPKEKKMKMLNEDHLLAKESRAKARARARERARERILNTGRPPSQLQVCERSSKVAAAAAAEEIEPANFIEESIVIRRKLKPSPGRLDYQPNLVISKDPTSNTQNSNYFPNFPLNWDITSAIAR
jgi:hypothetical protein